MHLIAAPECCFNSEMPQNTSIPKFTLRKGGGRHRQEVILKDNNLPIDVWSTIRVGEALIAMIFMSDETHLSNFLGEKTESPEYMIIGNLY
jgi:hypothetical protein